MLALYKLYKDACQLARRECKGKNRLESTSASFDPKIFERSRCQTLTSESRFLWIQAD
ncbi:hypothetical protein [Microcoleus vaginatus]|uniref:hypothetical protein n=1 Tax=Microcoleus vaginatus TaxID=119532 RepID=UPI001F608F57